LEHKIRKEEEEEESLDSKTCPLVHVNARRDVRTVMKTKKEPIYSFLAKSLYLTFALGFENDNHYRYYQDNDVNSILLHSFYGYSIHK